MEHLYLMDDDNFLYEHMANLRPGVVDLIQRNVCAMIDAGRKIHVQSADAVRMKNLNNASNTPKIQGYGINLSTSTMRNIQIKFLNAGQGIEQAKLA